MTKQLLFYSSLLIKLVKRIHTSWFWDWFLIVFCALWCILHISPILLSVSRYSVFSQTNRERGTEPISAALIATTAVPKVVPVIKTLKQRDDYSWPKLKVLIRINKSYTYWLWFGTMVTSKAWQNLLLK